MNFQSKSKSETGVHTFLFFYASLFCVLFTSSCKHESLDKSEDELYKMAKGLNSQTWYKQSNELLPRSSGSGHSEPFLRTRYNLIAAGHLNSNGGILSGTVFSQGALIVKELYESSSKFSRYAILYKKQDHPNADANGWVWGYINADGSVAEPSSNKGKSCINCHSQDGSIDYMLMNKYYP
jgi:hypothetical protein